MEILSQKRKCGKSQDIHIILCESKNIDRSRFVAQAGGNINAVVAAGRPFLLPGGAANLYRVSRTRCNQNKNTKQRA